MAISKLIFNGVTQMDLTSDTVTASVLNSGYTAHDAAGEAITGTGGGGGGSWSWMGKNPTLVHTFTPETVYFKDTSIATWTWSTSSTTLIASQSLATVTGDDTHDYLQVYKLYVHYDYGNWAPMAAIKDFAFVAVASNVRYATNAANAQAETRNALAAESAKYDYRAYYYNGSGTFTYSAPSYGVYTTSLSAASISNAATATPGITCKTPVIYLRGNTNYFSETALQNLNMNNSYYKTSCELWSVDSGTCLVGNIYADTIHTLNSGL